MNNEILDGLRELRHWEQYSSTGNLLKMNYGMLLTYLKDIREIQRELGCGRVYTAGYLGVETTDISLQKLFLLVVEFLPKYGATYENRPIPLAKMFVGWGRRFLDNKPNPENFYRSTGQVYCSLRDIQRNEYNVDVVYNTDDPIATASDVIKYFKSRGLMPIYTTEYKFGQSHIDKQYVFGTKPNEVKMLDKSDMSLLRPLLEPMGFELKHRGFTKSYRDGRYLIKISSRISRKQFLLSFQDTMEQYAIHWVASIDDFIFVLINDLEALVEQEALIRLS